MPPHTTTNRMMQRLLLSLCNLWRRQRLWLYYHRSAQDRTGFTNTHKCDDYNNLRNNNSIKVIQTKGVRNTDKREREEDDREEMVTVNGALLRLNWYYPEYPTTYTKQYNQVSSAYQNNIVFTNNFIVSCCCTIIIRVRVETVAMHAISLLWSESKV